MNRQDLYRPKKRQGLRRSVVRMLFSAYLFAIVFRVFLVGGYSVSMDNMEPGVKVGHHLLINKFIYGIPFPVFNSVKFPSFASPQRGSLILFYHPWKGIPGGLGVLLDDLTLSLFGFSSGAHLALRRVVALPGDLVRITADGGLMVNGRQVSRKFLGSVVRQKERFHLYKEGAWRVEQLGKAPLSDSEGFFLRPFPQKGRSASYYRDFGLRFMMGSENFQPQNLRVVSSEQTGWRRYKDSALLAYSAQGEVWARSVAQAKIEPLIVRYKEGLWLKVPNDKYFVLSDSRDGGADSRSFGFVPKANILGTPLLCYWPLSELGTID